MSNLIQRQILGTTPTAPPISGFVSVWKTDNMGSPNDSGTNQIKLPLQNWGTYNFNVDWGDGSSNTITSYNQSEVTHTFPSAGTYTVTITGTINGFSFEGTWDPIYDRNKIISITNWGPVHLGNFTGFDYAFYFNRCSNLNLNAVSDVLNTSSITNMEGMLRYCTSLTSVNNINSWDVSNVIYMSQMFDNSPLFNSDISSWDVGNVNNMANMFSYAAAFNQNIGSWDVSNVQYLYAMFSYATAFNQNLGSWNVSNVLYFNDFMLGKTPSTFSASNLDAIYNGWSSRTVGSGKTISFGTAKYTSAGTAGRNILTSTYGWTITDGGI